ncbi:hypothetical protein L917_11740 [Phytophthora nicotianae]|uniref:Uncharacterized protein n=1 Tax=Phytophthora nicotianae TaxID=4792 RepID=W2KXH7_PHYNI|nr:hypothetical protein L917_11740 [Phytophthora nicotianae]
MSSVNVDTLSTSLSTGYDPGDDAAPQGVPHDRGAHRARRAELEEAVSQLDSRAANQHSPERRLRLHDACVPGANENVHREAVGLEEMFHPVDYLYSLLLIHNQVPDLEHKCAQLYLQLDLLLHLEHFAPRSVASPHSVDQLPVVPPLAVAQPSAVSPPAVSQPHAA